MSQTDTSPAQAGGNVAALAVRVGRRRREQLGSLKDALQKGDERKALDLAKELVGLEPGEADVAHSGG